ncbi:MAG: TolC family protein [bacterium]
MKRNLITALFLSLILTLSSQELMTLSQALEIGLANNYGINMAKNSYRISGNNASPGNAGMLPQINANAGYTKAWLNAKVEMQNGAGLDNPWAQSDLFTTGVYLNWTLFDGLGMFINYDKLKRMEEIGELSFKVEVENTLAAIIAAYYDIVRQKQETDIIRDQVDISCFRLELARLRFETGSGSEMEFLKAKVELNADSAALYKQQTVYLNSKTSLNDLLSRDVNTPYEVKDTILVDYVLQYDSLRNSMRAANRNILMAGKNKEVNYLDMKSARAKQWPNLDFMAGYGYYLSQSGASFTKYSRNFGPTLGITATMPIYDGRNLNREYKNAKISLETSGLEMKQLESRLETYLAKIYNDYRNELRMIGFERENLQLAMKNMDIAKESYAVGSISSLQLREIQKDLLNANTRLVTAEYTAKLTETALLLLSGKLIK